MSEPAKGQGMFADPVDPTAGPSPSQLAIIRDGATPTTLSVKPSGSLLSAPPDDGAALVAGTDAGGVQRTVRTDASGRLVTSDAPGATVTSPAHVTVAPGATVALPVPPSGTRRMVVQNVGPSGTLVLVREASGTPGSGIVLPRFAVREFGAPGGSVAALEVQEIAGIATAVAVQFERD